MLLVSSKYTYLPLQASDIDPETLAEFVGLIEAIAGCNLLINWPASVEERAALYPGIPALTLQRFEEYVPVPLTSGGAYIKSILYAPVVRVLV